MGTDLGRPRRAWSIAVALALLSIASPSLAQPEQGAPERQPDAIERGRALYLEGLAAFEQGRNAEATRAFRAAYELSHVPAALYSLATTLRAQELYADALRATRALLRDHPDLDPDLRDAAQALLTELADRVGILTLRELPTAPAPVLRLDGAPLALPTARPVHLDVDPGPHRVQIRAPGRRPFEWTGSVAAGSRVALRVELRDASPRRPAPAPAPAPSESNPVPWIVAGAAGAVLIAAGIVVVVAVSAAQGPSFDRRIEI